VSFIKLKPDATYGTRASIRVDVLEYIGNGTVCIYDLKTGNAILDPKRMFEIAKKVFAGYGINVERIIVTEVRRREERPEKLPGQLLDGPRRRNRRHGGTSGQPTSP